MIENYFKSLAEKQAQLTGDLEALAKRVQSTEENKTDKSELKKLNSDREKLKRDLMEVVNKIKESVNTNGLKLEQHHNDIEDLKRKFEQNNKKISEMARKQASSNNQADMQKCQQLVDDAVAKLKEELAAMAKKL